MGSSLYIRFKHFIVLFLPRQVGFRLRQIKVKVITLVDLQVDLLANFGVLGRYRPKDEVLDPKQSNDLPQYLKRKKLTLADFEAMVAGTFKPPESCPAPLMDLSLNWQKSNSSINKIQTEHGLILTTRKPVEVQYDEPTTRDKNYKTIFGASDGIILVPLDFGHSMSFQLNKFATGKWHYCLFNNFRSIHTRCNMLTERN